MPIASERASERDFARLVGTLDRYWGERDATALHHPMFFHEFAETALVARDADTIAAYLLGLVTATGIGYAHVIAVHRDYRGRGLARVLYRDFVARARVLGAHTVRAISRPDNEASIALLHGLGMKSHLVEDYSGPGHHRVLFECSM